MSEQTIHFAPHVTEFYDAVRIMGLDPNNPGLSKIIKYLSVMLERNVSLNLTAITDPVSALRLHVLDSLTIFKFLDLSGCRVLDVGAGGGFPGAAIAAYEPRCRVTFLDSTAKKLDFVRKTCESLGICADYVNLRAEDYAHADGRGAFDVVTARAVAELRVLTEICLPCLRVGGVFAAYKADVAAELRDAQRAIAILGGHAEVYEYKIPGADAVRSLVIVTKEREAPREYPRRWAQIKKMPL